MVFGFRPEYCSASLRNSVRLRQNGVLSNGIAFSVNTLHITSVSPTTGSPGTSITITGTGFGSTQGSSTVTLGSMAGQVISWSDTQVVATVVAGSLTGDVRIQVVSSGGSTAYSARIQQ